MNTTTLRVMDIVPGTSVDGPGLRTSIYFAGCSHRCTGCHNPQSWPFDAGRDMTIGQIMEIVEENGFNVTFTGGDPMYQPRAIAELADHLHAKGYSIWCYTGFTFSQLMDDAEMQEALRRCDVIVDGPFQLSERDTSLRFRGSSNQRLIDVAKSIAIGNISLWND